MHDSYLGLGPEEFAALVRRYNAFQDAFNDPHKEPVKVYSPLSEKQLAEIKLIREVSKDLAVKKEEDMKKAAQKAAEVTEKPEDSAEEKKPEPEK